MRRVLLWIGVVIVALLLLRACGAILGARKDEPIDASTTTTSVEPTSANETTTPGPEPTTEEAEAPNVLDFDTSMVRSVVVNKGDKGGQSNVDVVVDGLSIAQLEQVGRQCVEHYLDETQAAFCQVWASDADYEVRDQAGDGSVACWIYYIGVPLMGGDPLVTGPDPVSYDIEECPGGAYR